jgi:hypothetical protein
MLDLLYTPCCYDVCWIVVVHLRCNVDRECVCIMIALFLPSCRWCSRSYSVVHAHSLAKYEDAVLGGCRDVSCLVALVELNWVAVVDL